MNETLFFFNWLPKEFNAVTPMSFLLVVSFFKILFWCSARWGASKMMTVFPAESLDPPAHCQHPQNAIPDGSTCPVWWKQSFRLRLWSLVWFQVRATSCHLTSSKSAWKSTPKCTWMCWRVWWSPGAIRWLVANPECGSRTQRRPTSPKRPRLGFRRSATTLYPSLTGPPPPPTWTRWTTSFGHTSRTSPTWPPTTPKPAWSPSIRRAPAGACGKGMFQVPDPYRGGDWGWRRLHWIDVSSTI